MLADDDVACNPVIFTATFGKRAIADSVATALDKIGNHIMLNSPATGGDKIDQGHRMFSTPNLRIADGVVLDHAVVGNISAFLIDLNVGIKIHNRVIARHKMVAVTHNMKRMFAVALHLAHTAYMQVLKDPVRCGHMKPFRQCQLDFYGTGHCGANNHRRIRSTCLINDDVAGRKLIDSRQKCNDIARIGIGNRQPCLFGGTDEDKMSGIGILRRVSIMPVTGLCTE